MTRPPKATYPNHQMCSTARAQRYSSVLTRTSTKRKGISIKLPVTGEDLLSWQLISVSPFGELLFMVSKALQREGDDISKMQTLTTPLFTSCNLNGTIPWSEAETYKQSWSPTQSIVVRNGLKLCPHFIWGGKKQHSFQVTNAWGMSESWLINCTNTSDRPFHLANCSYKSLSWRMHSHRAKRLALLQATAQVTLRMGMRRLVLHSLTQAATRLPVFLAQWWNWRAQSLGWHCCQGNTVIEEQFIDFTHSSSTVHSHLALVPANSQPTQWKHMRYTGLLPLTLAIPVFLFQRDECRWQQWSRGGSVSYLLLGDAEVAWVGFERLGRLPVEHPVAAEALAKDGLQQVVGLPRVVYHHHEERHHHDQACRNDRLPLRTESEIESEDGERDD